MPTGVQSMLTAAQIVLDPASAASQGARGVYDSVELNTMHRDAGYAELGLDPFDPGSEPVPAAPVNTAVPYVSQEGDMLNCTMGEWLWEPTSYAYAWEMDGTAVGSDSATHAVVAGDGGKTATCVVTATNDLGSTAAPPSNGVVVTEPPAREA